MEIISKNNLKIPKLPISIFTSIYIAAAISKNHEEFSIFIGLDKNIVEQLKKLSLDENDTELQKNTSDKKRFGLGSYEDWYVKNRTPFALVHVKTGNLATLVWFGPKNLLADGNNWHSVAWRSYPLFRGKGLMRDFFNFSMDMYIKKFPDIKFWAGIKKQNTASLAFASSLGFHILDEISDDNSLIMVKN